MDEQKTLSEAESRGDSFAEAKSAIEKAQAESGDVKKVKPDPESSQEQEIVIYGKAAIDGIAVKSADLENATENYPIVLLVGDDFVPVKKGDIIQTPYDAVMGMDEFQKIGPMIRSITPVQPKANVED